MGNGDIAGAAVGVMVLVAILGAVLFICVSKQRKSKYAPPSYQGSNDESMTQPPPYELFGQAHTLK